MRKPKKTGILLVLVISALAAAQNKEQASKPRPAPEMQRVAKMLVGTWKVEEDFAPGGSRPHGGKGTGHSVIRVGPGGFSLIEDFVSSSAGGGVDHLFGVYWWDKAAQGLRSFGCDDLSGEGCSMLDGVGRWVGNEVVTHFKMHDGSKTIPGRIVWAEKENGSFTATMYVADASGAMKRDWTFLHVRVK
jgi:hypothetical protein